MKNGNVPACLQAVIFHPYSWKHGIFKMETLIRFDGFHETLVKCVENNNEKGAYLYERNDYIERRASQPTYEGGTAAKTR
jgi:hypothetical protein